MKKKTLTIFTPAYNRAHTIGRTYDSLCRQTCKDFEWLIIDDGSEDNTKELVENWIKESKIEIRYIYQKNQGMHAAHNTAYRNIETELNTCIDSDDWMPDNAVEIICDSWKNREYKTLAGLIGLDCNADGKIIGTDFPHNTNETKLADFYLNGGKGDKKLVYRTDVIRKYPEYPVFEGEKYVGLAYKYMLVDQDYKLLVVNKPLVIVEYQQDGSSVNMFRQYWNNPKGFAFFRKTEMVTTRSFKRRIMICIHYVSSSLISKNRDFIKESPCKLLTVLAIPLGYMLFMIIKYKVSVNAKLRIG